MFSLGTLVLTGLVTLLIGGVIGAVLTRSFHPREKQNRDLEQRLQQAEEKQTNYQKQVSEHFAQTSLLVNNLTQSYREVHEYLANSALKLTNPDISQQILQAAKGKLLPEDANVINGENVDPPRDWAPKEPGTAGALSEEYGLKEDRDGLKAATVHPS